MPVVLNYPAAQRYPDTRAYELAQALAGGVGKSTDLLLQALLSGKLQRRPIAGTYQSPTGAFAQISPAEQVKGSPGTTLAQLLQNQVVPSTAGSSFTPTRFRGMEVPPDFQRMLQVGQLQNLPLQRQQLEADLAKAPFERKKLEAETSKVQAEAELYKSGGVPVYTVDPTTGQMRIVGTVNPKSKVVTGTTPLEKTMASQSAKTAVRSIGKIRNLIDPDYGGNPNLLLTGGIPGIKGSRELAKAFASVKLEIVTARGGKQLTPSEQQLVKATFPNTADGIDALLRRDPTVIQQALDEMQLVSEGIIQELEPEVIQQQLDELRSGQTTSVTPTEQSVSGEDFSQMSDEELQAIVAGR